MCEWVCLYECVCVCICVFCLQRSNQSLFFLEPKKIGNVGIHPYKSKQLKPQNKMLDVLGGTGKVQIFNAEFIYWL